MNMLLPLFLIAVSAISTNAQGFSSGKCLEIPIIKDLDLNKYVGDWYEIERFNSWFERTLKCGKASYGLVDPTTITVENSGVKIKNGDISSILGKASIIDPAEPNKLALTLPIQVG